MKCTGRKLYFKSNILVKLEFYLTVQSTEIMYDDIHIDNHYAIKYVNPVFIVSKPCYEQYPLGNHSSLYSFRLLFYKDGESHYSYIFHESDLFPYPLLPSCPALEETVFSIPVEIPYHEQYKTLVLSLESIFTNLTSIDFVDSPENHIVMNFEKKQIELFINMNALSIQSLPHQKLWTIRMVDRHGYEYYYSIDIHFIGNYHDSKKTLRTGFLNDARVKTIEDGDLSLHQVNSSSSPLYTVDGRTTSIKHKDYILLYPEDYHLIYEIPMGTLKENSPSVDLWALKGTLFFDPREKQFLPIETIQGAKQVENYKIIIDPCLYFIQISVANPFYDFPIIENTAVVTYMLNRTLRAYCTLNENVTSFYKKSIYKKLHFF